MSLRESLKVKKVVFRFKFDKAASHAGIGAREIPKIAKFGYSLDVIWGDLLHPR